MPKIRKHSSSESIILTIEELIDSAFEFENDQCIVHHKKIEVILLLIARKLKLLGRKVHVDVDKFTTLPFSVNPVYCVTEVKVLAMKQPLSKCVPAKYLTKQYTQHSEEHFQTKKKKVDDHLSTLDRQMARFNYNKKKSDQSLSSSLDSDDALSAFARILVVERVEPSRREIEKSGGTPGTLVNQDRFHQLYSEVRKLQRKFSLAGSPSTQDIEISRQFHKGVALTDGMAAVQLAARLEKVESMINMLIPMMKLCAAETGVDIQAPELIDKSQVQKLLDKSLGGKPRLTTKPDGPLKQSKLLKGTAPDEAIVILPPLSERMQPSSPTTEPHALPDGKEKTQSELSSTEDVTVLKNVVVTEPELGAATRDLYNEIMKTLLSATSQADNTTDKTLKKVTILNEKLSATGNVHESMEILEQIVKEYTDKITYLDTYLSSEMATNQEELTLMQYQIENGLEIMMEAISASSGCDPILISSLNGNFNIFQCDLEEAIARQNELKLTQQIFNEDLKLLRAQLDRLQAIKSNREDVAEALDTKVGIAQLNGLASVQQFVAVKGDLEKRIGSSYNKFNDQEIMWQKHLDEFEKTLNDKVNISQLNHLSNQIYHHADCLNEKVKFISEILGPLRKPKRHKTLYQEKPCLSCSSPSIFKECRDAKDKTFKAEGQFLIGKENVQLNNDVQDGICIPGYPISHPIDPRAQVCRRWCGGSHTKAPTTISRAPPDMTITNLTKNVKEMALQGKMNAADEVYKPCLECLLVAKEFIPSPAIVSKDKTVDYYLETNIEPISHQTAQSTTGNSSSSVTPNQEEIDKREGIIDH